MAGGAIEWQEVPLNGSGCHLMAGAVIVMAVPRTLLRNSPIPPSKTGLQGQSPSATDFLCRSLAESRAIAAKNTNGRA